jgi:NADH-quinone oxidoreductase subunit E
MLSTDEISEIEMEAGRYPTRQAVCIDALKIVQRRRGWVSDESLRDIAEHLGMSVTDLDSVATFYNLIFRRPVGRHVIMICDSVSCWMLGYAPRHHTG